MRKFLCFVLCALFFVLCSCSKKDESSYKEIGDYKKVSSNDYTFKYDDSLFDLIKKDGYHLILKSVRQTNPTDYSMSIYKKKNKNIQELSKEFESLYRSEEFAFKIDEPTLSTNNSTNFENAKSVSALANDGEIVCEVQLIQNGDDVFCLDYHFPTSLDYTAVENAIYSTVYTFKLK